jgi:hypothetical protein
MRGCNLRLEITVHVPMIYVAEVVSQHEGMQLRPRHLVGDGTFFKLQRWFHNIKGCFFSVGRRR